MLSGLSSNLAILQQSPHVSWSPSSPQTRSSIRSSTGCPSATTSGRPPKEDSRLVLWEHPQRQDGVFTPEAASSVLPRCV
jgi:hypothetical protein